MPKKKPAPDERHSIHLRLNEEECAAIDADRRQLPGIPVGRGAYAKHAVMSYARLRQILTHLQYEASNPNSGAHQIARGILAVFP